MIMVHADMLEIHVDIRQELSIYKCYKYYQNLVHKLVLDTIIKFLTQTCETVLITSKSYINDIFKCI